MNIGRKIYYELSTGNIIQDTGERSGNVIETSIEQDFASYAALAERAPETVGVIKLPYGEYAQDFSEAIGVRVDIANGNAFLFTYPDPTAPESPPVYRAPLSQEVDTLKDDNIMLMLAITDLYEEKEVQLAQANQDSLNNMLALTELYEMNLALQARLDTLENGGTA